jgi:hypothetical protein
MTFYSDTSHVKRVLMARFRWSAVRLVAVVLVATIASAGCAKPSASKVYAGEHGIPSDSPTGDSPQDLLLDDFAESSAPMGSGFGDAAGRRALDVSRAASQLLNGAAMYAYGQDPVVMASIEKAGHSAAQVMTAVSRDLDSAQALVGDPTSATGCC